MGWKFEGKRRSFAEMLPGGSRGGIHDPFLVDLNVFLSIFDSMFDVLGAGF